MIAIPTSTIRNRITLTKLGLGCAQFGNLFRETTDEACTDAVIESWNSGVRYIDVAPHYGLGLGERRVGKAIKTLPRAEIIISTKVGRVLVRSEEHTSELQWLRHSPSDCQGRANIKCQCNPHQVFSDCLQMSA